MNSFSIKNAAEIIANDILQKNKCKDDKQKKIIKSIIGVFGYCEYLDHSDLLNDFMNIFLNQRSLLFDRDFLNKCDQIKLSDMWPKKHQSLALEFINDIGTGLGTPNAQAGIGELFLTICDKDVKKSSKKSAGDIEFINKFDEKEYIEFKGENGKINSNISGKNLNNLIKNFCNNINIHLPLDREKRESFIPDKMTDFLFNLSINDRKSIWEIWWNNQELLDAFPTCINYTWQEIKPLWVYAICNSFFKNNCELTGILIIDKDTSKFKVFKDAESFSTFLNNNQDLEFEFRAHQSNPPAIYIKYYE